MSFQSVLFPLMNTLESFHSILRGGTKITDSGPQISQQAREIDAWKHELHEFRSLFVALGTKVSVLAK